MYFIVGGKKLMKNRGFFKLMNMNLDVMKKRERGVYEKEFKWGDDENKGKDGIIEIVVVMDSLADDIIDLPEGKKLASTSSWR